MTYIRFCLAALALLLFSTCSKEVQLTTADLLQNAKGWYAYAYKRADIGEEVDFVVQQPYLIIGAYGSGFKIDADGRCHIHYSDGSLPIQEGAVTKEWELVTEEEIRFSSAFSDPILVEIVQLNELSLWIRYELGGDVYEYKLRPIS